MSITRGLIISSPWVNLILEGQKTWEMRSTKTSHRGWFGLIPKGSGNVAGLARLTECGPALSKAEMLAEFEKHRISEPLIYSGTVDKWRVPWKISEVVKFDTPIPYSHKSGAVTWVAFSSEVADMLEHFKPKVPSLHTSDEQCGSDWRSDETSEYKRRRISTSTNRIESPPKQQFPTPFHEEPKVVGVTRLTSGNLRNNHFYLTAFLDAFPDSVLGGKNKSEEASRLACVDWGGHEPVTTDIDRTKRMFRKRAWVRKFFELNNAQVGDEVVVTTTSRLHYSLRLVKPAPRKLSNSSTPSKMVF